MAGMAGMETFDNLGRHTKQYQPRLDPFGKWREEQFISKYRLGTKRVEMLAEMFGKSNCSRTAGTSIGGGQSYKKQVGTPIFKTLISPLP